MIAILPAAARDLAARKARGSSRGTSLVELMVAVAILSLGVLGFIGAFRFITKSVQVSRVRTLATNLAQEKVENLKNLSYYKLLVTTSSAVDPLGFLYDTVNYPPETVTIGGVQYQRYTYVSLAQIDNDVISTVTYTYPDTGMKQMTVNIVWTQDDQRLHWTLTNLLENPQVAPLDSSFSGTVTDGLGHAVGGALVQVEQDPDWNATTDSGGNYSFRVYHGSYTVRASSTGYFSSESSLLQATMGSNTSQNFTLLQIGTGTIAGNLWLNTGLVISQVVGTTTTVAASAANGGGTVWTGKDVEYFELFNPTTYQINLNTTVGAGSGSNSNEYYLFNTQVGSTNNNDVMGCGGQCVYVSSYVKAGGYFLIASYASFVANGQWINADAYYNDNSSAANEIPNHSCGSIQIKDKSNNVIDEVCWNGDSCGGVTLNCQGTEIPLDSNCGMNTGVASPGCQNPPYLGNQLLRPSSPTVLGRGTFGSAYKSQSNATSFVYPVSGVNDTLGLNYNPFTTSNAALPVITGIPAIGAAVGADDTNSGGTKTVSATISSGTLNLPYAPFQLLNVATGTWNVVISTGSFYKQVSGVVVAQNQVTAIPNAATTPAPVLAGSANLVVDSTTLDGFVGGQITGVSGTPLSGIKVTAGGKSALTNSGGVYFMEVSSGPVSVVANPNNINSAYVQDIAVPTLVSGEITEQDFTLTQGGALTGYVTSGTTPLPGIQMTANIGGSQFGSATTDTSGNFTITNLSTGTYTVEPVIDSGQASSPSSVTTTVVSTTTVSVGTFTVTGAFGTITGKITYNGQALTTGALILASTATISTTPPTIAASSAPAMTVMYAASSKADGTYEISTRGSSTYTYRLSAYVPVISGSGSVSITTKTWSGISVSPNASTTFDLTVP